jgi:hypothetical protein
MSIIKFRDKKIHHVHIPRCAGKFIANLMISHRIEVLQFEVQHWPPNSEFTAFELEDENCLQFQWESHKGVRIKTAHKEIYQSMEDFDNCTHRFAVIRDPYQRFISALGMVCCSPSNAYDLHKVLDLIKTKEGFDKFMHLARTKFAYEENWLTPQHEFLVGDELIWKFEDGFGQNFTDWFKENFDIPLVLEAHGELVVDILEIESGDVGYLKREEEMKTAKIPESLEGLVREYYAKDYELLGY